MKKTVRDIDVQNKTVIARCDFNVPMKDGKITDDIRITSALPTINYLLENGAKLILMSHLGRPEGEPDPKYTLKPVAERLSELLEKEVVFISSPTVVDDEVRSAAAALEPGDVMLLENVRYRKEETKNDPAFSKELADLADVFVNDAFGTAHRAHSSTAGIANYLPAVSGFLIEKEMKFLGDALEKPERPLVAVIGGAKVSDKIKVIENLLKKVDTLIIGGGMAFTFIKALGNSVGKSLCEEDKTDYALQMLALAKKNGKKLLLPKDVVCATEIIKDAQPVICGIDSIPDDMMGLDIGPATVAEYVAEVKHAGTVIWNGPMGVFEFPVFANGTLSLCMAMAASSAVTVVGGGDSASAVDMFGYSDKMTHISTGGGASLEFLEGKVLPGIACIEDK